MSTNRKRANDSVLEGAHSKRPRIDSEHDMVDDGATHEEPTSGDHDEAHSLQGAQAPVAGRSDVQQVAHARTNDKAASAGPSKPKHTIRKLVPPRPFPTVPASVSATGPRSAHAEGKNYICITRKTQLGAYLRRCKDVVLKDGYKTLHLSAMGAAIPHLMQLTLSLPGILPYGPEEIKTEVLTGTVQVQDEIMPDDDDEDITYQTRGKSTVSVVITIGDGMNENVGRGKARSRGRPAAPTVAAAAGGSTSGATKPKKKRIQPGSSNRTVDAT